MEEHLSKRCLSEVALSSDESQQSNKRRKLEEQRVLSPDVDSPGAINNEERPFQHQSLEVETFPVTLSLDDVNDHCILEIFKYFSVEELNSAIVFISQRYHDLRNHDSLDQTRTGTIMCTKNTTLESIRNAFERREWNEVFTGNRTRMKVVGLERMPLIGREVVRSPNHVLPNVSSLDLSFNSFAGDNDVVFRRHKMRAFALVLPNLEEIDLSHTSNVPGYCAQNIGLECPHLRRVIWNASEEDIPISGYDLPQALTEVYLDNSHLYADTHNPQRYYTYAEGGSFMLHLCNRLERLSVLNVTWANYGSETVHPVTQEMLIKMVRHHPTLRWLRSDLTQENIARLQQERPDITFVSE